MTVNDNFDKLIKKEKRKKTITTIAISLVTTLVVIFVGYTAINQRMSHQYKKAQEMANITDMIESPNLVSTSQYLSVSGRVTSQLKSERFKNIDGYVLAATPLEINFSLFGVGYGSGSNSPLTVPISKTKSIGAFSRENGEKVPLFFDARQKATPAMADVKPTHEAKTLASYSNHVGEVAVSFKTPLTYSEIQTKLPENVLINWYWIGKANPKLTSIDKVIGINADEKGQLNDDALKTKQSGNWSTGNYPSFVAAVKTAADKRGHSINGIDIYQDALKQVKTYPTLDKAKFSGVIVSGRTENLAKLDDLPEVYATNVGLTAEIVPYIEPTK